MKSLGLLLVALLSVTLGQESVNVACEFSLTSQGYTCFIPTGAMANVSRINITTENHQQDRNNYDVVGFTFIQSFINFFPLQAFNLFPSLEDIIFTGNNIPMLESNVFVNQYWLRRLSLQFNMISSISSNALLKMSFLEYLNLSLNSISSLPQGIFRDLISLTELNLRGNLIVQLNPNMFEKTFQLAHIDVAVNKIRRIDLNTFDNLEHLESLMLVMNDCVDENFEGIQGENHLRSFVLPRLSRCFSSFPVACSFTENTQILGISEFDYTCSIYDTTLEKNQRQVTFVGTHQDDMSNNNVVNLRVNYSRIPFFMSEMFTTFPELKAVEISYGGLETIRADDFVNAKNLESLYLRYNNIKVLNGGTFSNLPKLQKLSLGQNEIEIVIGNAFSGLKSLRLLYLNDNRIRRLHINTLNSLNELRDLNLGRNYLTGISSTLFRDNPQLGVIMLDSNQISAIDENFLDNLPRLSVLNLISNKCVSQLFDGNRNRINEQLSGCYEAFRSLPAEGTRRVIMEIDGELSLNNEDGLRIVEL
jgi:Leucine-rich repeat (LRR) protein